MVFGRNVPSFGHFGHRVEISRKGCIKMSRESASRIGMRICIGRSNFAFVVNTITMEEGRIQNVAEFSI
jgi:hypothetical protein